MGKNDKLRWFSFLKELHKPKGICTFGSLGIIEKLLDSYPTGVLLESSKTRLNASSRISSARELT